MSEATDDAPRFSVSSIECFERPVDLRLPFRFGAATVREAPQAFVRVTIRAGNGRTAHGMSAELMIPKWFDKDPRRSNTRNINDLRTALGLARDAYCGDRTARAAFSHATAHYRPLIDEGARHGLNALTASYGAALVDRAILDALCRMHGVSFAEAIRANVPGIDARLTPDLARFHLAAWLASLRPVASIAARHTVGMADPLGRDDVDRATAPDDGLPVSLRDVIAHYGNRYFKIKLGGDVASDVDRLVRIAAVIDALPEYAVSLDGNEQFSDARNIAALLESIGAHRGLERLRRSIIYLEQPLPRSVALATDVHEVARTLPLIIDESDATVDAFPQARALGYAGISSKSCKGVYKALLNAARCAQRNDDGNGERAFMTGEDLTSQPGVAVQQDLALVALLGLAHVERNGHHYASGFSGQRAPVSEQQAFLAAHPDLYETHDGLVALVIRDGRIALRSIAVKGYGAWVMPDARALQPMPTPQPAAAGT